MNKKNIKEIIKEENIEKVKNGIVCFFVPIIFINLIIYLVIALISFVALDFKYINLVPHFLVLRISLVLGFLYALYDFIRNWY